MLELKVKALGCGIPLADIAKTPVEAIVLGWEAERLRLYHQAIPALDAQMAKLSPVALGKSRREENERPKDAEEAKRRAQDEKDRKQGEPILEQIKRSAYFRLMPTFMQAAEVRARGWPASEESAEPIQGLSASIAREIIKLGESGAVPDSVAYWASYTQLRTRLYATARVKG